MYDNLSTEELRRRAHNYRATMLEGGEGYNPYQAALEDREAAEWQAREITPAERKLEIIHQLEIEDCSLARESGTYDAATVAALRSELGAIEATEEAEFLARWPRELTEARRAEWNARVRAGEIKDARSAQAAIDAQGWGLRELKRALKAHNL